jgi:crotonobetainyl-CoA:carnitine CoA-transferase CaiB-like acyl-CoA transferase
MAAPLDGIRVLEVSNWLAAPSAAALMRDLGAEVVKVEPPTGDIFRHFPMRSIYPDFDFALQYAFEFDNRGKQSIVIALDKPDGPELVRRLAADVDIFVTNLTQPRRERYGLTDDDVLGVNLVADQQPPRHDRRQPPNPIWNSYPTSDDRWVLLVMPQPDPYWGAFCAALREPGWEHDQRYDSLVARLQNSAELVTAIEERFVLHDLAYWGARLDEFGLIWAPVASLPEVIEDPQVEAMDLFAEIEHPQAGPFRTLKAPFTIRDADLDPKGPAPSVGEHTQEVLASHGLSAEEIADLASQGIFG